MRMTDLDSPVAGSPGGVARFLHKVLSGVLLLALGFVPHTHIYKMKMKLKTSVVAAAAAAAPCLTCACDLHLAGVALRHSFLLEVARQKTLHAEYAQRGFPWPACGSSCEIDRHWERLK